MIQIEVAKKNTGINAILFKELNDNLIKSLQITDLEQSIIKKSIEAKKNLIKLNRIEDLYLSFLEEDKKEEFQTIEKVRLAGNQLYSDLKTFKVDSITLQSDNENNHHLLAFAEGLALGSYQFEKYKSKPSTYSLKAIKLYGSNIKKEDCKELQVQLEAVFLVRDLVNTPVIGLNAAQFSEEIKKAGKKAGFKTDIFNKAKIEALNMGGLLGVNAGSVDEPTFNIMEYKPKSAVNEKPLVLVGKGVVYDTGGLSIKTPSTGMETMKCDMAGGAAVLGIMYLVSKLELPVHIVGLVPATDNRLNGNAIAPGDVITISDGTTVEVLNTDAEGRLILADALHYAKKYNPELVFDFATLTGAAQRAIGHQASVFMGTVDKSIKEELINCGYDVFERLVEFPLWNDYAELLKSDIADLKNISGGASSGAITAGKFLEHFTDYPWIHFDIAGTAFNTFSDAYRGPNASGVGVRLIYNFIKKHYLSK